MRIFALVLLFAGHLAMGEVRDFSQFDPLTAEEAQEVTGASLTKMSQEERDILYSRLASGPIPQGKWHGHLIFADEGSTIEQIFGILSPTGITEKFLKEVGTRLWSGKNFYPEWHGVMNRIGLFERFPAKVFCGQSLIDSRRESIIIDYRYADDLAKYSAFTDWLTGRDGLSIRDEIRMVRPGLYLGRSYVRGLFALNFVLEQTGQTWASGAGCFDSRTARP